MNITDTYIYTKMNYIYKKKGIKKEEEMKNCDHL